jgi:hypothetical protein
MTVRAYILIETADGKAGSVRDSVGHGLMNCLALGHNFQSNEVVAHLECNELEDLHRAITVDLPRLDGVKRITPVSIVNPS